MASNHSRIIFTSLAVILIAVLVFVFIIDRKNDRQREIENILKNLSAENAGGGMSASEEQAALKNLSAPGNKSLLSKEDEARALKLLQR